MLCRWVLCAGTLGCNECSAVGFCVQVHLDVMSALPFGSMKTTRNLKNGSMVDEMSLKFKRRSSWNAQLCNTKSFERIKYSRVVQFRVLNTSSYKLLLSSVFHRCRSVCGWGGGGAGRTGVPRTNQQVLTRCINGSRQIRYFVYRHLAAILTQATTQNSRPNIMTE